MTCKFACNLAFTRPQRHVSLTVTWTLHVAGGVSFIRAVSSIKKYRVALSARPARAVQDPPLSRAVLESFGARLTSQLAEVVKSAITELEREFLTSGRDQSAAVKLTDLVFCC